MWKVTDPRGALQGVSLLPSSSQKSQQTLLSRSFNKTLLLVYIKSHTIAPQQRSEKIFKRKKKFLMEDGGH